MVRDEIPPGDLAAIDRFCGERIPAELAEEIRLEREVRGASVTIVERRPPT